MSTEVRKVTLLAASAAGAGAGYKCDYRFGGVQQRTVVVAKQSADAIAIQGSVDDGVTWVEIVNFAAAATVLFALIQGPWDMLRAVKTGTGGIATVTAIL